MKLTLNKLNELKDFIKLAWIARASGWDRSTMHTYVNDPERNMASTTNSIGRLRNIVAALKKIRKRLNRVIWYYERQLKKQEKSQ